ncbi:CDP-diacylglycerol--glycerol-3-phosphate 3-phosphatidyltransferase [Rhodohalobacter sp. SW132]|uniref:CDP-diacylglycerol--glycerol-3-phosphate 3-phosphatidyltransferase n=1 Tax=Rhodohalobacter sp. SW132 TaxID=2293433 RepID=UPI001F44A418|nr:CDP-diacylglycerol--glycerol-3-phosphate 3-phosphatidyltransferase [Rhodohalobacter sp. SW132]
MEKLPNILSSLRLILAPIFLLLFIQDDLWLRGISLVVYTIAALTDYFDGYYARRYEVESDFGVFLDPLADKVLTFAAFVCLPFLDPSQFPWWAIGVIVFRDIAITMLRVYSDRKGIMMETRKTAKAKTAIQMGYLYVALLLGFLLLIPGTTHEIVQTIYGTNIMYWGMMVVVAITVYSGVEYLYVNRKLFSDSK